LLVKWFFPRLIGDYHLGYLMSVRIRGFQLSFLGNNDLMVL
jgi:hypothetical protein